jgi:hypothetical protein
MDFNDDEKLYAETINILQRLRKIKPPENFEVELRLKINSGEEGSENRIWLRLMKPAALIPAAAVVLIIIVSVVVLQINSSPQTDPLVAAPQQRTDMITTQSNNNISLNQQLKNLEELAQKKLKADNGGQNQSGYFGAAYLSNVAEIRNGLNFREVNLNRHERMEVNQLKQKMEKMWGIKH